MKTVKVDSDDLCYLIEACQRDRLEGNEAVSHILDKECVPNLSHSRADPYLRLDFADRKGGFFLLMVSEEGIGVTYFKEEHDEGEDVLTWEWKHS